MVDRLNGIMESWNIPFRSYNRNWLVKRSEYEYPEARSIFNARKGGGYWAWKPLIILDALETDPEVLYLDSSVVPQNKESIFDLMNKTDKVSAVDTGYINGDWTKRDCFRAMECDDEKFWNAYQVWAGVIFSKISGKCILEEWRRYCLIESIVTDKPSLDNLPNFKDHRHDQSILTNLLIKHNQVIHNTGDFLDLVKYS